jgi:enoyl-CoA hydratase/carnithine racemase
MSKPTADPDVVFDSIGGNVGSLQNLNDVVFAGPAVATTAAVAAPTASATSTSVNRLIRPSSCAETPSVLRKPPEANNRIRPKRYVFRIPLVDVTRDGAICVLTLRREEKLNALSTELERELGGSLAHDEVRSSACVVVTGSGRAFSAGADVSELRDRSPEDIAAYYRETGDVYERVAALPQPTLSAISGYCLGGGLELALATDFRIADGTAVFGFPELALGILPSSGGTQRLTRVAGTARAKELILLRERFDAREALAAGVITELVPDGTALDRALELAQRLAGLPPLAVSLTKQAIDAMPEASREAGILIERLAYGLLAQTKDAREA